MGPRGLPHGWPPPTPKLFLKCLNESNSLITAYICFDKFSIFKLKLVLLRVERVYAWLQFSVLLILCFININVAGLLLHTCICKLPNSSIWGKDGCSLSALPWMIMFFNCCSSCFVLLIIINLVCCGLFLTPQYVVMNMYEFLGYNFPNSLWSLSTGSSMNHPYPYYYSRCIHTPPWDLLMWEYFIGNVGSTWNFSMQITHNILSR